MRNECLIQTIMTTGKFKQVFCKRVKYAIKKTFSLVFLFAVLLWWFTCTVHFLCVFFLYFYKNSSEKEKGKEIKCSKGK